MYVRRHDFTSTTAPWRTDDARVRRGTDQPLLKLIHGMFGAQADRPAVRTMRRWKHDGRAEILLLSALICAAFWVLVFVAGASWF